MREFKSGDLVVVRNLYDKKESRQLGIILTCESFYRNSAIRCSIMKTDGQLTWRFGYELELISEVSHEYRIFTV